MDHDTYYSLSGNDLVALEPSMTLPDGFRGLLSAKIEFFLDRPLLTIGSWDEPNRPHVLALDASGHLVSIISVDDADTDSLPAVVESIVSWLTPLRLRDLSDLTSDPVTFYEGLWDLSPDASIALRREHQLVFITASTHLDVTSLVHRFDGWTVQINYLDVLNTADGTPIIKRRSLDQATTDTKDIAKSTTSNGTAGLTKSPRIRPGATFPVDRLPLLFDPLGADLISISDELFAVDQQLVLVDKLSDQPRESPFEDRNRFRWHGLPEQIGLLAAYALDELDQQRTIHLFVETDRQSGYCVYIGEISPLDTESGLHASANRFSIDPPLDIELFRLLQNGQLPEHFHNSTVDFGTLGA